jgi:aryl-alcohol dehydrogenase-like predicted oxidoreductase
MQQRTLASTTVSAIGLGGMPMSIPGRPDRARSIATIHAALDAGVTLIDTADAYTTLDDGQGHNEELIAEALRSYGSDTSHVLVATKGGHVFGEGSWPTNGRPEHLHQAARDSAARLGVDAIGLYQFHRPDPDVPFEESIGALAELLDDGIVVAAGVSNTSVAQIETANRILGGRLASVQNQFSPAFTSSLGELDYCTQHDIAFLPWSPLGGIGRAGDVSAAFQQVADAVGVSPQQVTLAWELALGPTVIPIPGASRPTSITDSAAAADLVLTDAQVAALSASVAPR